MKGRAGNHGIVKHHSRNNYRRHDNIYNDSSKIPTMDILYFYAILISILFVFIKFTDLIYKNSDTLN